MLHPGGAERRRAVVLTVVEVPFAIPILIKVFIIVNPSFAGLTARRAARRQLLFMWFPDKAVLQILVRITRKVPLENA